MEELGLIGHEGTEEERAPDLLSIIDRILRNHSGIGVKTLKLRLPWDWKKFDTCYVDRFLETAIAPGIQELTVMAPSHWYCETRYNFPCSLLASESGESIRCLKLTSSSFRPTSGLGCLTRLQYLHVHTGNDELGCFLSNSLALRHLQLFYCDEIICLKIPRLLWQLRSLEVFGCKMLQMIESSAPNISEVHLTVHGQVDFSLGDGSSQVKKLQISSAFAGYNLGKLPSITPSLENLTISLLHEVSTPMVPGKFCHLKYLDIYLPIASTAYDCLSLLAVLDSSPALETFILWLPMINQSCGRIHGEPHLTRMPEFRHGSIKNVMIRSFCPAESLIELTCRMLQHIASLERMMLDTIDGRLRCSWSRRGKCCPMKSHAVREAQEAVVAIRRYIKPQVPCNVDLTVVEPCSYCHVQRDN